MDIYEDINILVNYGIEKGLIDYLDRTYIINQYLDILSLESYEEPIHIPDRTLEEALDHLTEYAYRKGLIPDNTITYRDQFDTKLMGVLTPRPSQVIHTFQEYYKHSPIEATDYFYQFSQDTNYIRKERINKDIRWKVDSDYGVIDISINLSKPEKDPKAIAAARKTISVSYPKCQLCVENEGYRGRINHPARENHRIIPIDINKEPWGFQYSPYVYYNEHCIVLNTKHIPMIIDHNTFVKLFDFIDLFSHYFIGSNADLPIVGGSILSHEHFQGGHYTFAMEKAKIEKTFTVPGYDVTCSILHWPLSVIRLNATDKTSLIDLADHILASWRQYTDKEAMIYSETEGEKHNTITPIARKHHNEYELDLVLRNNLTTEEYPLGLYHPHPEYHHIKKENIGLIEVMGLAVLPSRLKKEIEIIKDSIIKGKDFDDLQIIKHQPWLKELSSTYDLTHIEDLDNFLKQEIGKVYVKVLEDAGVYKCTPQGREAFDRFLKTL